MAALLVASSQKSSGLDYFAETFKDKVLYLQLLPGPPVAWNGL